MTAPGLGLPWYIHPAADQQAWTTLAELRPRPSFVVVNVHNGPGQPDDEWYPAAIGKLAGHRLLGYVDLDYGKRSPGKVSGDVRTWLDLYPVAGVMFDQYPSSAATLERCWEYVSAARRSGADVVVGNPGTTPDLGHLAMLDAACVFEGSAATYAGYRPPEALSAVPADRLWHLVHSCPPESIDAVTAHAAQLGAGHAFVTDGVMPHPWGGFPTTTATASGSRAG